MAEVIYQCMYPYMPGVEFHLVLVCDPDNLDDKLNKDHILLRRTGMGEMKRIRPSDMKMLTTDPERVKRFRENTKAQGLVEGEAFWVSGDSCDLEEVIHSIRSRAVYQ